ncbi:hypothetical protein B0J11DRAFT_446614 [Dendryphion nanum]|uniref:Ankyrin repeat protein n=1 Tax=Dendryphion nanum TaxID=256645 RepID=A0A9P9IAU9_9PLEO|nr:hypothetical protein B0J11DRAFT_446614 [Dendryphion nanum]
MAEVASSAVTLATLSLAIISKIAIFLNEAKTVHASVSKLHDALEDFRKIIESVKFTCRGITTQDQDPSRFVSDALAKCYLCLERVELIVNSLASRPADNLLQRINLKIKLDRHKNDIEESIQVIESLMQQINTGITLDQKVNKFIATLRIFQHITGLQTNIAGLSENDPSSHLSLAWSQAETVYEGEETISSCRASLDTNQHRASFYWQATHRPQIPTLNAIIQIKNPEIDSDWERFHHQINMCKGQEGRIRAIQTTLQQHPQSSTLANSTIDKSKRTPLHLAAQHGDTELARILISFSANINAQDSQPRSVLDLALAENQDEFITFLLDHNVDQTIISEENLARFDEIKTALDLQKEQHEKATRKVRKRLRSGVLK